MALAMNYQEPGQSATSMLPQDALFDISTLAIRQRGLREVHDVERLELRLSTRIPFIPTSANVSAKMQ